MRCQEQEPDIIVDEEGVISAICAKCYIRELMSPKKSEFKLSLVKQSTAYRQLSKSDYLNKSFFNNEGKMVRKVEKFFSKFENKVDDILKELSKRALIPSPITWDKVVSKCDKAASLMFIFIGKQHIIGAYHAEAIKIGDKAIIEDSESGFFMSNKNKMDVQFYKANCEAVVYNPLTKTISFGKPSCFDIVLDGNEMRVKTDIVPIGSEWVHQFVYKL